MNAKEDNEFSRGWKSLAAKLPAPTAIVVVSAHWETLGTKITTMEKPRTIHDFGGFPEKLFQQNYPAPGHPKLAAEIIDTVKSTTILPDEQWGLDHGTWSILLPMCPKADIPVIQLSLDRSKGPAYHFELAKELRSLRKKGVLIIGSGNIVHNLGRILWEDKAYDWEHHARWIQLPLPSGESTEALHWTVSGMTESSARYLRYGFSQFTLSTTLGTYHIGRLSHGLFQVSTGSILRDPAALQGLTRIDPQRQLLCVGSVDDTAAPLSKAARLIAESERLVSSCTTIREHLESSLSRRRCNHRAIPVRL